jgi:hypothetical protein
MTVAELWEANVQHHHAVRPGRSTTLILNRNLIMGLSSRHDLQPLAPCNSRPALLRSDNR